MKQYLDISPEVAEAITTGKAVVALESTIIPQPPDFRKAVQWSIVFVTGMDIFSRTGQVFSRKQRSREHIRCLIELTVE